jgi:hypothetical protein
MREVKRAAQKDGKDGMTRHWKLLAALGVLATLALAGCGGESQSYGEKVDRITDDSLIESSVTTYVLLVREGDADLRSLQRVLADDMAALETYEVDRRLAIACADAWYDDSAALEECLHEEALS